MYLSETARAVHVVCRGPDLDRTMSRYLVSRLERAPNVRVRTCSTVTALRGQGRLESVVVSDRDASEVVAAARGVRDDRRRPPHGLAAGGGRARRQGLRPDRAGPRGHRAPARAVAVLHQPAGVFAVGDARSGSVKRVASAVGEGAVVVQAVHRYLADPSIATVDLARGA
jgi:thioredoxin reductase (NADPH)